MYKTNDVARRVTQTQPLMYNHVVTNFRLLLLYIHTGYVNRVVKWLFIILTQAVTFFLTISMGVCSLNHKLISLHAHLSAWYEAETYLRNIFWFLKFAETLSADWHASTFGLSNQMYYNVGCFKEVIPQRVLWMLYFGSRVTQTNSPCISFRSPENLSILLIHAARVSNPVNLVDGAAGRGPEVLWCHLFLLLSFAFKCFPVCLEIKSHTHQSSFNQLLC